MKRIALLFIATLLTFLIGVSADVSINKAIDSMPPTDADLQSLAPTWTRQPRTIIGVKRAGIDFDGI